MRVLTLRALDRIIRVGCQEPATCALVSAGYGPMQGGFGAPDLDYIVGRDSGSASFFVRRAGGVPLTAPDDAAFLALLDGDVLIELQKLRSDLYFIHAAVLQRADTAVMLVAQSGGGKSTLCWALLHHGFRYLSDELGPVDLAQLDVHPYPRGLALKSAPPAPYPLPPKTVRTSRSLHVIAADLPGDIIRTPARLSTIFFLAYDPEAAAPSVQRLSSSEAAARLYANALNPLAHAGDGLDAAIRIATESRCYELTTAELSRTCALVSTTLAESL